MVYLSTAQAWIIFGSVTLFSMLLLAIILYLAFGFRFKRKKFGNEAKIVIDEEYIESLIEALGGNSNISGLSIENGRVKFVLENLELINQKKLIELSPSGAFLSGYNLKLLFKYDSKLIVEELNKRGIN